MRKLVLFIFIFPYLLYAFSNRNVRGELTENSIIKENSFSIQLSKNQLELGEENLLHLSFSNKAKEVVRFYPYFDFLKTFQIFIVDEENRVIPLKKKIKFEPRLITKNFVGANIKEIILNPNEAFSKTIDLNLYFNFKSDKKYFVKSYFFPNYFEAKDVFIDSNEVYFYINKKEGTFKNYGLLEIGKETINPNEIVSLFLNAEKRKDWKNYFKFIHFPEFIISYDKFSNLYANANFSEKSLILEEFKYYLTQLRFGNLENYEILNTQIINSKYAKVKVFIQRNDGFIVNYEYEYILKKDKESPYWKISSVIVGIKK